MAKQVMTLFRNPVIPGFHPDPSICRVGDRFYLVVSSFEYFPGIPIFTSTDLVTWTQLGHVLTRFSQLDLTDAPASGGIYAPTIRHHDGIFYVTSTNTSASGGGHFIVHAKNPAGPWSDPVWVNQNGIDPTLFFADGQVYFSSNVEPSPVGPHIGDATFTRGIQQSLIDPLSGAILDGPRFIWEGTGARFPEAPHMFRRGDYYYLVIAEGGTEYGHMASVGRARSPWGPFEPSPYGPLIDHRSIDSPFQAVGHADFVTLPDGNWWAVCLGVRPVGHWPHHLLGRETLLAKVEWAADQWPLVGAAGRVPELSERPRLPADPAREEIWIDDFNTSVLKHEWAFVRTPAAAVEQLTERPGWLTLRPGGRGLSDKFPCFAGRRQQHYNFAASASLCHAPDAQGDQAGLAVRVNERHCYAVGLVWALDHHDIVITRQIGDVNISEVIGRTGGDQVRLTVRGTPDSYTFIIQPVDGEPIETDAFEARFLATEFVGGFTGTFIGLYASAVSNSDSVAQFDLFEYRPGPANTELDGAGLPESAAV